MDELQQHHEKVRRVEIELNAMAATHPGVQLLKTIPGVGPRTAEAVMAWIDRPGRFSKNKAIGSYFGLILFPGTSIETMPNRRLGVSAPDFRFHFFPCQEDCS